MAVTVDQAGDEHLISAINDLDAGQGVDIFFCPHGHNSVSLDPGCPIFDGRPSGAVNQPGAFDDNLIHCFRSLISMIEVKMGMRAAWRSARRRENLVGAIHELPLLPAQ
jgi:hypothetical protein